MHDSDAEAAILRHRAHKRRIEASLRLAELREKLWRMTEAESSLPRIIEATKAVYLESR